MIQITRRLEFDYGHRLLGHESKCSHYHGHRGVVEIVCTAEKLDGVGRVIDFSKIKELVGGWINEKLDHNMILNPADPLVNSGMLTRTPFIMGSICDQSAGVVGMNPTAENIVVLIAEKAWELLRPFDISVVKVRLYETPNCWADFAF